MAENTQNDWFATWFDSPYYHLLYQHRDHQEAAAFIDALVDYLRFRKHSHILDLACGAGRHSNYLATKGFKVTGLDLSAESIERAKANAHQNASFGVADMRELGYKAEFDHVLNLFTSFGYFDDFADNLKVLQGVFKALKPGGRFVLDYLNPARVQAGLVPEERIEREGVTFEITRRIESERVKKRIAITDGDQQQVHEESVQLIESPQLQKMLKDSGFLVQQIWGNYELKPYQPSASPRMIFLSQKPY